MNKRIVNFSTVIALIICYGIQGTLTDHHYGTTLNKNSPEEALLSQYEDYLDPVDDDGPYEKSLKNSMSMTSSEESLIFWNYFGSSHHQQPTFVPEGLDDIGSNNNDQIYLGFYQNNNESELNNDQKNKKSILHLRLFEAETDQEDDLFKRINESSFGEFGSGVMNGTFNPKYDSTERFLRLEHLINDTSLLNQSHKSKNLSLDADSMEGFQNDEAFNYSDFDFQSGSYIGLPDSVSASPHSRRHQLSNERHHRFSSKRFPIESKKKKTSSGSGPVYTKWSKWSRCSRHCQQTKRRRCKIPSLCGTALIKEKRPCVGWRCQHEKFHLIKPEEIHPHYADDDHVQPAPRADVRVLLNYNSMFYTKWSQWSACSHTCLTSRYRSCRYPLFCGNAVIREEAYCYVKGTACENWYQRNKLGHQGEHLQSINRNNNNESSSNNLNYDPQLSLSEGPRKQVIFGHNKYFTENLPISPEDEAHILNINIGNHRFGVGNINKIANINHHQKESTSTNQNAHRNTLVSNDVVPPQNKLDKWFDSYDGSKTVFKKPNEIGSSSHSDYVISSKKNSLKQETQSRKTGFINNYSLDHQNRINSKTDDSHLFSSYPIQGRKESLPKDCGKSSVEKPQWSLRIIGGRESTPDKWPWQVAILNHAKEVFCGGTLVAPQWVITAAHCLRKRLYVRLAEHDLAIYDGQEVEFKIKETVPHPLYDSTTVDNDVALLRLPKPVQVGIKMAPVCMPDQGASLPIGHQCTIIGWGKVRHSHFFGTEVLNEAEVPIIDEDLCRKVYSDYYITQNMFCAGHQKGRVDSCAGDSGGPLLCHLEGRWYIYGITSFGEGCGRRGKFGIYARVSNYKTWVNDVIAAHAHRTNYPVVMGKRKQRRRHSKQKDYQKRRNRARRFNG